MNIQKTDSYENRKVFVKGYVPVNGLNMYYEIHGTGKPLVLIHGGGSTIQTSFGRVLLPFAKDRQVIAMELQGHGHTADIAERPESFEQDADDVAVLLKILKIDKADFFGFSNGGNATIQLAYRHPYLVRKMILGSTFYKREGLSSQLWESLGKATLKDMPVQLKEEYKQVAPHPEDLIHMFEKDKNRMLGFIDWKPEVIQSILSPALILLSDQDVVLPEHAVEMFRLMPHSRLAILPGAHGAYMGEITTGMEHSNIPELTVSLIQEFLNEPLM